MGGAVGRRATAVAGVAAVMALGVGGGCGKKREAPVEAPAEAEEVVAMRRLVAICEGARSFVAWEKRAPKAIEELVYKGFLDESMASDPWGRPFVMAVNEYGELEFYSDGPDGKARTKDDLEHFCQEWRAEGEPSEDEGDDAGGGG